MWRSALNVIQVIMVLWAALRSGSVNYTRSQSIIIIIILWSWFFFIEVQVPWPEFNWTMTWHVRWFWKWSRLAEFPFLIPSPIVADFEEFKKKKINE
jgi:hypothetical protein